MRYSLNGVTRVMRILNPLLVLLVIAAGCSYVFEINVDGKDPLSPVFTFRKPGLFEKHEVPMNSFGVYTKSSAGQWDYRNPIWSFGLELGASKEVSRITYGVVPEGFKAGAPAKKLVLGEPYLVGGSGAGGHGSAEFTILEKNGSYYLSQTK